MENKLISNDDIGRDGISVLMPVYNQTSFIRSAITSLMSQCHKNWELIIVDDGSTDNVKEAIADYLDSDKRLRYIRYDKNRGLGYALNIGLSEAQYDLITYLPADDLIFDNHLTSLLKALKESEADMAYSGVRYRDKEKDISGEGFYRISLDEIDDNWLQLVQVLHRKTNLKWIERKELVTDNLGTMFWDMYIEKYPHIVATGEVTCEWVSHTYQRHSIMNDRKGGGIYMYKTYYGVTEPLRYKSIEGNYIDEYALYKEFRKPVILRQNGLKILLVGELSYNPERIYSLEKRGHRLYGLWIPNPLCWTATGPLAFGNVETIPFDNWEKKVEEIKTDIIYGLTNYRAIDLVYHVFRKCPHIPLVWHFKEGPFYARNVGQWTKLMELVNQAAGTIYINEMAREWYHQFMPHPNRFEMVLDGDLPPMERFNGEPAKKLSSIDGEPHTCVAGRLFGLSSKMLENLADNQVHLHLYGDIYHNQARSVIEEAIALVPDYIHLHPSCPSQNWFSELSKYDAGWLHWHESFNKGDLKYATWPDFNSPARMSTYAVAGIPMIMRDNSGNRVHYQEYLSDLGMAIPVKTMSELGEILRNKSALSVLNDNVRNSRYKFSFDNYVEDLEKFFYKVVQSVRH